MHLKNLIHRDIKPENFLISKDKKKKHLIYLIDFGMAKRFKDKINHIPIRYDKEFLGTAKFASVYTHMGIEQSRRDDLEGIGYVLVYLATGSLPWIDLILKSKKNKYNLVLEKKKNIKFEDLCSNLPSCFVKYFNYVRSLQFEDQPDYQLLRGLFREAFEEKNYIFDYKYDWFEREDELINRGGINMNAISNANCKYNLDQVLTINQDENFITTTDQISNSKNEINKGNNTTTINTISNKDQKQAKIVFGNNKFLKK